MPTYYDPRIDRFRIDLLIPRSPMLSLRTLAGLDQEQEPAGTGGEAGAGRGLGPVSALTFRRVATRPRYSRPIYSFSINGMRKR
jgi:hypothetical protein